MFIILAAILRNDYSSIQRFVRNLFGTSAVVECSRQSSGMIGNHEKCGHILLLFILVLNKYTVGGGRKTESSSMVVVFLLVNTSILEKKLCIGL